MRTFILLLLFMVMISCDDGTDGTVTANVHPPEITLHNETNKPVHYFLIETGTSHLIDLADPCYNFRPNLPANSELTLPYDEIYGFNEEARSAWFSWTDCQGNSGSETIELF
ncbi:hypothetical protein [Gracilimonas mengyeensis]|uniref:Uncharacterized protein n=1 Tax=Gracilimonas mengyeensis TaxID=1302730 RepID=A0A521CWI0_9BACT|nr:hypothetical protein [Gracilimonas mengyeensis]SMO63797.1 hypothetical protein SAMN06265219_106169 [Gracilimonas mengyeensis]